MSSSWKKKFLGIFLSLNGRKKVPEKENERERERGMCSWIIKHNQANVSSRRVKYNFPRIIPELNDIHYADNRGGSQLFKPSDAVPLLKVSQIARGATIPVISRPESSLNKVFRNFPRHSRANNQAIITGETKNRSEDKRNIIDPRNWNKDKKF